MQQDNYQKLIRTHKQRLAILEEKAALFGISTPPHILIEITDIKTKLQKLGVKNQETLQEDSFMASASPERGKGKMLEVKPGIFISYSHKDEAEKEALVTQLQVLQFAAKLTNIWHDDLIQAGADWEDDIKQAMAQATLAILLISANSLTSRFILNQEVKTLLERRKSEGLIVYPIIAKPCAWQTVTWLSKMNVKPKNGLPVWRDQGVYVDEELAKITQDIAKLLVG